MEKPRGHEKRTRKGETREDVNSEEPPFSAIASLLFFKNKIQISSGTGFLVKDGDLMFIVTAAHCLFSDSKSRRSDPVDRVQIYFGLNQQYKPYGSFHKSKEDMIISKGYDHLNHDPHDYGVIRLDKDDSRCLPKDSWFILCDDKVDRTSYQLQMSGYPQYYYEYEKKRKKLEGIQLRTNVVLEKDVHDNEFLCYKDTTCKGNSGSPIYYKEGDNYIAVGIHCTGNKEMNYGVPISEVVKSHLYWMGSATNYYSLSPSFDSRKRPYPDEGSRQESTGKKNKSTTEEDSD